MSNDPVEERKEAKPKKVFSVNAIIFDDGVIAGTCIEYRDLGRLKNQKCIVPSYDDFLACVRSLVPLAVPAIEKLTEHIFNDIEIEDLEDCVKIGKVVIDIYNDGFIDCDFSELVQGQRGAPKAWRLEPRDFFHTLENRVGQLTLPFKALIDNGGFTTTAVKSSYIDEGEEIVEE